MTDGPTYEQEARAYRFSGDKQRKKPEVVHTPEGQIVNAVIRWLHAHGVFNYRQNTGAYKPEGSKRYIRYGYPGSPDVIAVLPKTSAYPGVFLGIEAKTDRGKQQDSQIAFQRKIEDSGAFYFVVRSLDDMESLVKPLLRVQ